jgi:hypothetical protein
MNSHSSLHATFDTRKFYEKLLILDIDENLLDESAEDRLAGRMIGAGFDTFDDMITQVSDGYVGIYLCMCVCAVLWWYDITLITICVTDMLYFTLLH